MIMINGLFFSSEALYPARGKANLHYSVENYSIGEICGMARLSSNFQV
jgi:hypothetical protein